MHSCVAVKLLLLPGLLTPSPREIHFQCSNVNKPHGSEWRGGRGVPSVRGSPQRSAPGFSYPSGLLEEPAPQDHQRGVLWHHEALKHMFSPNNCLFTVAEKAAADISYTLRCSTLGFGVHTLKRHSPSRPLHAMFVSVDLWCRGSFRNNAVPTRRWRWGGGRWRKRRGEEEGQSWRWDQM